MEMEEGTDFIDDGNASSDEIEITLNSEQCFESYDYHINYKSIMIGPPVPKEYKYNDNDDNDNDASEEELSSSPSTVYMDWSSDMSSSRSSSPEKPPSPVQLSSSLSTFARRSSLAQHDMQEELKLALSMSVKSDTSSTVGIHSIARSVDFDNETKINNPNNPNNPNEQEYITEFPGHVVLNIPVVSRPFRTGLQRQTEFDMRIGVVIANRYVITRYIGSAAFSQVIECEDLQKKKLVAIKIIENDKEFVDQSLDEIKVLKILNDKDPDNVIPIVRLYNYFYYKEHLLLVCELLKKDMYQLCRTIRSSYKRRMITCNKNVPINEAMENCSYLCMPLLAQVTRQLLISLQYIHKNGLIHSDLKPENILCSSYSPFQVKIIDFGSSCFYKYDYLSSYVQSRSYRAPETILGCKYGANIDIWSLGCILFELYTGKVLFSNQPICQLLGKMVCLFGNIPIHMIESGRFSNKYYAKVDSEDGDGYTYRLFKKLEKSNDNDDDDDDDDDDDMELPNIKYIKYNNNSLEDLLYKQFHNDDEADERQQLLFIHLLNGFLQFDPAKRLTVKEALEHPWLKLNNKNDICVDDETWLVI